MAKKSLSRKSKRLSRANLFLAVLLIVIGIGLIFFSSNSQSKTDSTVQIHSEADKEYPVTLYIPKIHKILQISNGTAVDSRWTVSDTGVSYLTSSALPGTIGNSVIYGHNRREILGTLPNLSTGERIYITTSGGQIITYEVFEKKEIKPTQVEILNSSEDYRLTIYTCSGFLDQSRFVVIAKQVSP